MTWLADVIVLLAAVAFAVVGFAALVDPARLVGRFGVHLGGADARNLIRSTYGGLGVAAAGSLVAALVSRDERALVWIPSVFSIMLLGLVGGRLISLLRDRTRGSRRIWAWLAAELILSVALFGSHVLRLMAR